MNSPINTRLVTGFIEDQIRAAAEARLPREYQRQPAGKSRPSTRRGFAWLHHGHSIRGSHRHA
jgi:hypothetical protein